MLQAVLFDIGDVLMHFETSEARRYIEVGTRPVHERLRAMGHRPPEFERYTRCIRRAFVRAYLWSRTVARREVPTIDVLRRVHARMGIVFDAAEMGDIVMLCMCPFERFFSTDPQAVPTVRRLHEAGFKLAIVSNTFFPHFAIDEVLEREGLLEFFPVRIYSSDVGYMKPHPGIFRAALSGLGVSADQAMHVGDLVHKDVKGAVRSGIKSVLFRKGVPPVASAGRYRPDYVISELGAVLTLPCVAERLGAVSAVASDAR
jgi:putative hydrolase of the HAD superfamily